MKVADIKVGVRYLIIVYFMYLAWVMTRPEYLQQIKDVGEIAVGAIYTSVFGVLGWVVKSNWSTTPSEDK